MAELKFDITGDNSNMLSALQGVQNGVRQTKMLAEQSGTSVEQMFSKIRTAATTAMGVFSAKEFASNILQIRGQFQQLEVAFSTMLGSAEKANTLMNQLVRTAATTPFDLKGVADGAKQLLAYGTQASDVNDTIVRLGDIAAGLSIPLNDLVYLYGTTMTQGRMFTMDLRQFMGRGIPMAEELAKIFGVTKNEVAELVSAGKVGSAEVQKAIENMTNSGGRFGGLMEAQSHTITGQISNIEDAVDMMYNDIGKQSEGAINTALAGVSFLIENYKTVGGTLASLVGSYGAYKAALMAIAAIQGAQQKFKTSAELNMLQAEIDKTNALLPAKSAAANADLQEAVAKRQLTEAQAELIAAKRAELASSKSSTILTPINEEIASLQALLAAKEGNQNADLQEAVASGTLTQEMAAEVAQRRELLISLQEQVAAKQQMLQQRVTESTSQLESAERELDIAINSHQLAEEDLSLAYQQKAAADARVQSALEYLDAQKAIESYEDTPNEDARGYDELQTALAEQAAAANQLKTASENENSAALAVNSAQEQVNAAEKELNTAQTSLNTISQGTNTTVTNANTAVTNTNTIATKTNTLSLSLSAIQAKASAVAQTVFAVAINGVKNAWNAMKIAMMSNPIGAIIGAVSMAIGLFMTFADTTDDASESTKKYSETADQAAQKAKGLYAILESDAIHTSKVQKDTMNELKSLAEEYGITLDKEKDLYSQLIEKKEELIGLIQQEAIERQKANEISAAGDAYQKELERIKNSIKDSVSDSLSEAQKNILVSLVDDATLDELVDKLKKMNAATEESTKQTGMWKSSLSINAIADYNNAVALLGEKIRIYTEKTTGSVKAGLQAKSVIESQAYALSHTREEYINNIDAIKGTADAALSASLAVSKMTEEQIELSNRTKLAKMDVETLGSAIDSLIKAYNDSHIDLKISYTELNSPPSWMLGVSDRMSSSQLKSLAAYHQAKADKARAHKAKTGHELVQKNAQGKYTTERQEQVMAGQYSLLAKKKSQEEARINSNKKNKQTGHRVTHQKNAPKNNPKEDKDRQLEEKARLREQMTEQKMKWALEDAEQKKKSEEAQTALALDLIEDEAEKERVQRELEHQKTLDEILKQEEEYKQANFERAKAKFDLTNKDKTKNFYDTEEGKAGWTLQKLTEDQQRELESRRLKEEKLYTDKIVKIEQDRWRKRIETMREYLKQYGTIQEQRQALTQEYNEKIAKAETTAERMTLTAQKERAIKDFNQKQVNQNLDWQGIFGDLSNQTIAQLKKVKQRLREMLSSNDLDLEGYKTAVEQIDKVNQAIVQAQEKQKGFFDFSTEHSRKRKQLENEVAEALEQQYHATAKLQRNKLRLFDAKEAAREYAERAGVSIEGDVTIDKVDRALQKIEEQFGRESPYYNNLRNRFDELATATRNVTDAQKQKGQADQNVDKAKGSLSTFLSDLPTKLKGFMQALDQVTNNLNDLPELLSIFGVNEASGLMKGVKGLAEGASAMQNAFKDLQNANFVGAATNGLKAISSLVNSTIRIFSGEDNKAAMEEEIANLTKANEKLAAAIDALSEEIGKKDNTNQQSVKAYKEAVKAEKEWRENQRRAIDDRASEFSRHGHGPFGIFGRSSFNHLLDEKGGNWWVWQEFNRVLKERGFTSKVYGSESLWRLSPEEFKELQKYANAAWRELFSTKGESSPEDLVNQYIERAGGKDKLTDKLNEKLTGYSWEGFKDSYLSVLQDMQSSTEDFANNIEKVLNNAILSSFINTDAVQSKIKYIYEAIAEAAEDDNITNIERAYITTLNKELSDYMLRQRNLMKEAGILTDNNNTEQQATAHGISSITFEQANNLVALTTAGNISRDQIKDLLTSVLGNISTMGSFSSSNNMSIIEIRNLMIYNNSYLADILKYSKSMYLDFSTKIDTINKNLKELK